MLLQTKANSNEKQQHKQNREVFSDIKIYIFCFFREAATRRSSQSALPKVRGHRVRGHLIRVSDFKSITDGRICCTSTGSVPVDSLHPAEGNLFPHRPSVSVFTSWQSLVSGCRGQRSGSLRYRALFVSDLNHFLPLCQEVSKGVTLLALLRG